MVDAPPFPIETLIRAADSLGVDLDVSEAHGDIVIGWLERRRGAASGSGAHVVRAVLNAAGEQGRRVVLACTGGLLEDYYRNLGFRPIAASRDEETGDVDMLCNPPARIRSAGVPPVQPYTVTRQPGHAPGPRSRHSRR